MATFPQASQVPVRGGGVCPGATEEGTRPKVVVEVEEDEGFFGGGMIGSGGGTGVVWRRREERVCGANEASELLLALFISAEQKRTVQTSVKS